MQLATEQFKNLAFTLYGIRYFGPIIIEFVVLIQFKFNSMQCNSWIRDSQSAHYLMVVEIFDVSKHDFFLHQRLLFKDKLILFFFSQFFKEKHKLKSKLVRNNEMEMADKKVNYNTHTLNRLKWRVVEWCFHIMWFFPTRCELIATRISYNLCMYF